MKKIDLRRRRLLGYSAAALAAPLTGIARAATEAPYPNRPVRIIAPYSAGGSLDVLTRYFSIELGSRLNQSFIVENRVGANGIVGMQFVARAPADGYTLLMTYDGSFSIAPVLKPPPPFEPLRDFTPLSMIMQLSSVLVAGAEFPANNLGELMTYIKAHPKDVSYACAGVGSQSQIAIELFAQRFGGEMTMIPYPGIAPMVNSLLAGQVNLMMGGIPTPLPHIKSGRLKAIAYGGTSRHPLLPDVPTFAESGLPGYQACAWNGLFGPAGMPKDVVATLSDATWAIATSPEYRDKMLLPNGYETSVSVKPAQFPDFLKDDRRKYEEAVKLLGTRVTSDR